MISLDMDFSSAMLLPWYVPQNKSNSCVNNNIPVNFGGLIDNSIKSAINLLLI